MKSLNKLLLSLLSIGLVFGISACGDDDPPAVPPAGISITDFTANGVSFEADEEYTGNHDPGSTVNFQFHTSSSDGLNSYKAIKIVNEEEEELAHESLSGTSSHVDFDYEIDESEQGGNEILIKFIVQSNYTGDEGTQTRSIEYNIVITRTLQNLVLYENITIGAQKNDEYPQFLSLTDGQLYTLQDASDNPNAIDLVYFDHSNFVATFGAPGSEKTESVYNLEADHGWTTFNGTVLRQAPWRNETFNASSNDRRVYNEWHNPDGYEIRDYYGNLGASPPVCILFETENGKLGMILVKNLVVGNQGSITVDIKIQE